MPFCIQCSFVGTVGEVRKHQFNEHYEYFKLQCNDDSELMKSEMEKSEL